MPLLFAYGTLREDAVQLTLFGRLLRGHPDELFGFERSEVRLDDPRFAGPDRERLYPIVTRNGRSDSRVSGTVFELTDRELADADAYEPFPYTRIAATLASGIQAWVYVDARPKE